MKIRVTQINEGNNSTLSSMTIDGRFFCYVLEDKVREQKVWGETAIPSGFYRVEKKTWGRHFIAYSHKFGHKFSFMLENVPNFQGIFIHIGNTIADTNGCLVVGMGYRKAGGEYAVMRSTEAYKKLYAMLEKADNITIEIIRK